MKKLSSFLLFSLLAVSAWAQGPNNSGTYYQAADGKKGAALKTALSNIIYNRTERSYSDLWTDFRTTDARPDGKVWDMYSNITNYTFGVDQAGSYSGEGDVYNREHSFPRSWFGGVVAPMNTDLFHLYPTDGYVNGKRSNYPFGETDGESYKSAGGFSKLGQCKTEGYTGTVFEPNDEYKGDFARTYFYMVTCYEDKLPTWYSNNAEAQPTLDGNKYPGLASWQLNMLMRWAKQDPVSEKEINRNNAVYGIQNNRNPFIDYPGLEDYVWGTMKDEAFSYDHFGGGSDTIPPVDERVLDPEFSPLAGTYYNSVQVAISCPTIGASIYYTLDGTEPSINSTTYTASFELTKTTTVKAIAYIDGMYSQTASATYVIEQGDTIWVPDGEIALNSEFFGVDWNGTKPDGSDDELIGTSNGITITYSKGTSSYMFCNSEQIRLYGGNELKIEAANGEMTCLEFVTSYSSKTLLADKGSVDGYIWTGKASSVTFGAESGSGHIKMSAVKVTMDVSLGIEDSQTSNLKPQTSNLHDLQGRRVTHPTKGLYIRNGHKVLLK